MQKRTQTDILGAILETLDLIQLGFEKMNQPEESKKGKKSKKTKQSSDNKSELSMNSSFDVLENIKIDKQKA